MKVPKKSNLAMLPQMITGIERSQAFTPPSFLPIVSPILKIVAQRMMYQLNSFLIPSRNFKVVASYRAGKMIKVVKKITSSIHNMPLVFLRLLTTCLKNADKPFFSSYYFLGSTSETFSASIVAIEV